MQLPSVAGVEERDQVLGAALNGLQVRVAPVIDIRAGPSAASVYFLARGC